MASSLHIEREKAGLNPAQSLMLSLFGDSLHLLLRIFCAKELLLKNSCLISVPKLTFCGPVFFVG